MEEARVPYVAQLDGLRGVAVAAVLLFHGGHLLGGYLGVDLFFVLSGYLITSLLLAEVANRGSIALGRFWARRARRLLPALFLMMVGVVLYAAFVASPAELHRVRYDAIATLAYTANWREVVSHTDYWSLFTSPSPLQHTWSLAIEEQFYLVWPLVLTTLVLRARRSGGGLRPLDATVNARDLARRVLWVAGVLAATSAVLSAVLDARFGLSRAYYGTDTRAVAILAGASLAALLAIRGPVRTNRGRRWLGAGGLLGAGVLTAAWSAMGGSSPLLFRGGSTLCALAAAAVIAAAVHPRHGALARVLRFRPLVLLGVISYGVYLWHWPIFVWLDAQRTGLEGWALFIVQCATTIAVATASFAFVERPIRRGALRTPRLRTLAFCSVVPLLVALVVSTSSVPVNEGPAAARQAQRAVVTGIRRTPPTDARLLVVGNSVAYFLARDGLSRLRTRPPLTVVNGALPDCNFPDATELLTEGRAPAVIGSVPCSSRWAWEVDTARPQVVLFTEAGALGELRHENRWLRPCSAAYDAWFATSLRQAEQVLTGDGARLVLATSAYPEYWGEPQALWHQTACINAVEADVARHDPRVSLVDLNHYVCPVRNRCRGRINGVAARPDGIHFQGRAALGIASWLLPQLQIHAQSGQVVTLTGR